MILSVPLRHFNCHFMILFPPVKNNMMLHGLFTRIIYSTQNVTMNGIFITIQHCSKGAIYTLERDILNTFKTTKHPVDCIERQVSKQILKSTLKISGIWETETTYGLAYKMF